MSQAHFSSTAEEHHLRKGKTTNGTPKTPGLLLAEELFARRFNRDTESIVRITVPMADCDPVDWLYTQDDNIKVYYQSRRSKRQMAGVGKADLVNGGAAHEYESVIERVNRVLKRGNSDDVRYYGSIRFDPSEPVDPNWRDFGAYWALLPRFECVRTENENETVLACNLTFPEDYDKLAEISKQAVALKFDITPADNVLSAPVKRTDKPDQKNWCNAIETALEHFDSGRLEKIVLARESRLEMPDKIDGVSLIKKLRDAKPDCFYFYLQPNQDTAFIGATPERLYRRHKQNIYSEAIAGTRPRGESEAEDNLFAHDLATNDKDFREHAFVRDLIAESLGPLCKNLSDDKENSVLKLARRQHLIRRFEGLLKNNISDEDLLRALHPTPAVGGHPRRQALTDLAALEPFDRGGYAGPVGWVNAHGAEFVVAIRSGLVRKNILALYSGAGIVKGSVPMDEWNEIEQKISDFVALFEERNH